MNVIGYCILKVVIEITTFIGLLIILKKYCSPKCLEWEPLSNIFIWADFKAYLQLLWPILYGWYSSYVCFELVIAMAGYTRDVELLAAWVTSFQ
jgi:hypothetical protein